MAFRADAKALLATLRPAGARVLVGLITALTAMSLVPPGVAAVLSLLVNRLNQSGGVGVMAQSTGPLLAFAEASRVGAVRHLLRRLTRPGHLPHGAGPRQRR